MAFLAALRFLTALPLPPRLPTAQELAAAPGYFPVVGLTLGLMLAAADGLLRLVLPSSVVSALLLVVLLGLTGGLHLDGLADTCDGFFANATPARRLEIMRDSRVGGYGVAGVASLLLVQYAALSALPTEQRAASLTLMGALSRWAMSFALLAFPYAHQEGMGAPFREGPKGQAVLGATVSTLLVCVALAGAMGVLLLATLWAATWLVAKVLLTRLPGLTGDTYGAINEVAQAVVLVLLLVPGSSG